MKISEYLNRATAYQLAAMQEAMDRNPDTMPAYILGSKTGVFDDENPLDENELSDLIGAIIAVQTLDEIQEISDDPECNIRIGVSGKASRVKRPQN